MEADLDLRWAPLIINVGNSRITRLTLEVRNTPVGYQAAGMATCLAPCSYSSEENGCHLTQFCRKQGLLRICELDDETRELLQLRTGMTINMENGTLCFHHEQLYIQKYVFHHKYCCDPKKVHKKSISKLLKTLTIQDSKELNNIASVFVKPGQKLCYNCLKMLKAKVMQSLTSESEASDTGFTLPYEEDMLNKTITELGVSPVKFARVSEQNKLTYGKRKVRQIESVVSEKVAHVLDVESGELSEKIPSTTACSDCEDIDILVSLLKEKMHVSSKQKQIQLLTIAPQSWSIARTVKEFSVSEYRVKEARKLKKEKGILAEPESKVGKPLSKDVEERATAYYENDEHSRLLPGAKDYKSVKGPDGKREHKQKRLLLLNLNELYENYKVKY